MSQVPNDFTTDKVLNMWRSAMRNLYDANRYRSSDRIQDSTNRANSAGHALSSTIEYGIKLHMIQHWQSLSRNQQKYYERFNLPGAVEALYIGADGSHKSLYSNALTSPRVQIDDVDFEYLKSNRDLFSNNTAHKGIDLQINDLEIAAAKIGEFLNCYLIDEVLCRPGDFVHDAGLCANFYDEIDGFESTEALYVLINDGIPGISNSLEPISRINWDVVIDFDPDTFSPDHFGSNYGVNGLTYLLKPNDMDVPGTLTRVPGSPVYYMANGWTDHDVIDIADPWRQRAGKANDFIKRVIANLAKKAQQVFVVSLSESRRFNTNILSYFESSTGHIPQFKYYVLFDSNRILEEDHNPYAKYIDISINELCDFLSLQFQPRNAIDNQTVEMPYRKDDNSASGDVSPSIQQDYSRYFELIHLNVENEDYDTSQLDFYIGAIPIPWIGVSENWPVVRDKLIENFADVLERKVTNAQKLYYLKHPAGIGGSTFSRQTAFFIHRKYPTLFLRSYSDANRAEVARMIENLYDKFKLPLFVFVEVPYVIEFNELEALKNQINDTRPILFVGIAREDMCSFGFDSSYSLPDWGVNFKALSEHYKTLISDNNYDTATKTRKLKMCDDLCNAPHRKIKTPFELGLIAFDKDYQGIKSYVANSFKVLKPYAGVCRTLEIMALCDYYGRGTISNRLIREIFKDQNERPFYLIDKFPSQSSYYQLIKDNSDEKEQELCIRHSLLSTEILEQFRGMSIHNDSFKNKLFDISKELIDICASAGPEFENFVTNLFINRERERDEAYSRIVSEMNENDRIPLFQYLVRKFPANAHFHSHLGRCYSKQTKEFARAIECVNKAIDLSPVEDYLLYHMKAECLSKLVENQAKELTQIDDITARLDDRGFNLVTNVEEAAYYYEKTRSIQLERHKLSGYGYDGHISTLLNVLGRIKKLDKNNGLVLLRQSPFNEWIETAQSLILELKHLQINNSDIDKELYMQRHVQMHELLGDYSNALQHLQNVFDRKEGSNLTRRLYVGCHILRDDSNPSKSYKQNPRLNEKLLNMAEDNLSSTQACRKDFNLWLEIVGYSNLSVEECAAKIMKWSANIEIPYIHLYNFAMQTVLALNGDVMAAEAAKRCLAKCRSLMPNNTVIRVWIGKNSTDMMNCLIKNTESNLENRSLLAGSVNKYERGSAAYIRKQELDMDIFFKPDRNGLNSSCLNHDVSFHLGVSYDGLIAENVSLIIE